MLAFLALLPSLVFAGGERSGVSVFDVSYLWTRSRQGAFDYREKVARILGEGVAKDLLVVRSGRYYGVVYDRDGTGGDAVRIALAHTDVLKQSGLEGAAPVLSRDWTVLEADGEAVPRTSLAAAETPTPPAEVAETGLQTPPREASEAEPEGPMEAAVEEFVKGLRRRGRIEPDERTAWAVFDFTTGRKLVTINEDEPLQAASMIKPFFALAYFHEVERGRLKYTSKARRMMRQMIQHSSNRAANWVLRRVGGPQRVQAILAESYGGIFQHTRVTEYIPPGGRTYRNLASAHDYSRFLYALWNDRLPGSQEIKRLMRLPSHDRISDGARKVPRGTIVYSKTGSTKHLCGDMGILVARGADGGHYPYSIVGVIEKASSPGNYTTWIRSRGKVIRRISSLVYERMARRHPLQTATEVASSR